MMRILHATDYVVQSWKNGGGMTTEIVASPPGASFDAIDWRISMARVERAGPFSMFAGIDRSLGVLDGEGMVLAVKGRGEIELKPGMHPAVFPGDVPVAARLPGGPILDLNVMSRRRRWRHHLSAPRSNWRDRATSRSRSCVVPAERPTASRLATAMRLCSMR
jgi:uncharacterized protein